MDKRLFGKVLVKVMGVSFFYLFTFLPLSAQPDEQVDLGALYQQIDDAIKLSPQYVAEQERQITACRDNFLMERNLEKKLSMAEKLFKYYKSYRNDSALHYAEVCISLSDTLRRPDLTGRYRSMLAYQCSNADMYAESLDELRAVDRAALDSTGLVEYYHAWMHVYGELGLYTQREGLRQHYFDLQNLYRDSVLMVAGEGSEEWLHLKVDILSARQLFQDALQLSNEWLKKVTDYTHESAYAAFYRSMVYDRLKNHEMTCYWLGKSALDDIRCAVMNQASLLFLAEHLANEGDISRACRYMEFAKECNLAFSPKMRAYQVNPVISVVEKSRQAAQERTNVALITATVAIVLLIIALICIFLIRRTRTKNSANNNY